jgi:choline monooxygenase
MQNDWPYPTVPLSWYAEPAIFEIEQRTILASRPDYVGCLPLVPARGCHSTIAEHDHADMLVRDDEVRVIDNICLHRGAQMMKGRGQSKAIVCPLHLWSYRLNGQLLKAPHYPEQPCLALASRPVRNWNGLLFAGDRDIAADFAHLGPRPDLDISHYVLSSTEEEEQPFNWKVPIEVLLENYHVGVLHPGFSRFVDPAALLGTDGTDDRDHLFFQQMRPHPQFSRNPGSAVFERWQRAILEINGGPPPFAFTIALYPPNVIVEWWPYTLQVTTYVPKTVSRTLMTRTFAFDAKALEIVPEYPELVKAAWYETQNQDEEAHVRLQRGHDLGYARDRHALSGYRAYQTPMEDGLVMFHAQLMKAVSPSLMAGS